jgi:peptide chain release factor subunit 3
LLRTKRHQFENSHCGRFRFSFNPTKDLTFMPASGITGQGIKDQIPEDVCPWYRGPAFIPFIDDLPFMNRNLEGPFIMPIVDKYKDMGTVVMGKVESGTAKKGQNLLVMPNRVSRKWCKMSEESTLTVYSFFRQTQVSVDQLWSDDEEVTCVAPGENVKIKLKVSVDFAFQRKVI